MNFYPKRLKTCFIILLLIVGYFLSYEGGYLSYSKPEIYIETEKDFEIRTSMTYENITIDNFPGSWNNWEWAESQIWCSG
jgi:hypothetical protein